MTLSPIRWHQVPLAAFPTVDVAHNEPLAVYRPKSYKKKGWTTVEISRCAVHFQNVEPQLNIVIITG